MLTDKEAHDNRPALAWIVAENICPGIYGDICMKIDFFNGKYRVVMGRNRFVVSGPYDTKLDAKKRRKEIGDEFTTWWKAKHTLDADKMRKVITQFVDSLREEQRESKEA